MALNKRMTNKDRALYGNEEHILHLGEQAGTPVVLVHGAVCDTRIWNDLLQELNTGQERITTVRLPGFWPDVSRQDDFSGDKHVSTLVDVLSQIDEPVHLVGHSRGGRIALVAAALCPGLVRSLVLAEPGGVVTSGFYVSEPFAAGVPILQVADLVCKGFHNEAVQLYIDSGHGSGTWRSLPPGFQNIIKDNAPTILGMIGDGSAPLDRAQARCLKAPVLLVEGSSSPHQFSRTLDVLAEELPLSTRRTMNGAGHFFPIINPGEFAALLTDWWANIHSG